MGKPAVYAEVNTPPRNVREMTGEELLAIIQAGRAERAAEGQAEVNEH